MKKSMNMGGSVVSKNILENKGRLKWCFREKSVNEIDNGWRFLSENFTTLSSIEGQYLGPVPSIIPENNGDLSKLFLIISCVFSFV